MLPINLSVTLEKFCIGCAVHLAANSHFYGMSCCALQVVLNNATVETDNPDLRDRAYIYWRLLSTDPEVCFCCTFYCF